MTRKLTLEYIQTRTKFTPEIGQIYENEGGGKYRCTGYFGRYFRDEPIMENIQSGWTLIALEAFTSQQDSPSPADS